MLTGGMLYQSRAVSPKGLIVETPRGISVRKNAQGGIEFTSESVKNIPGFRATGGNAW
jgi:hypothetical protein